MKDWLKLFFAKSDAILLTLNGKTFKKSDCQKLGGGAEKNVYQIKETNQCFFIPNKTDREIFWDGKIQTSEDLWNRKIEREKALLDQISTFGLKTQRFEILPLKIEDPGKSSYILNVLVTKDFKSLCEEESIVIYNKKEQEIIGTPPNFIAMQKQFKEKHFAQKVVKKIIAEYAVAFTFTLPSSILYVLDDSEHLCFELPKDATEPPVARYMFWDVLSDFRGVSIPIVPTLNELKLGSKEEPSTTSTRDPLQGLINLAYQVASPILKMSTPAKEDFNVDSLAADLLNALNDDDILNEALAHARKLASQFIENLLKENEQNKLDNNEDFILLMESVISVGEFDLFLRAFRSFENPADMPQEDIDKITFFAQKYKVQPIIDYLNIHLVQEKAKREMEKNIRLAQEKANQEAEKVKAEEKRHKDSEQLKNDFLQRYNKKLTDDKNAWCGMYSFFVRSYTNEDMSLKELVEHAQGRSQHGSGKRSKEIMKTMGWLDESNEVTDKISSYIM
ncbi:hypothetical protein DGG96_17700 [Legionella qingyii]|uniref:Uncharacterized protein n=1 Tax=Legionella qingyii TaxID=2184757 RepID=A0A317U0M5_9GAMM|nr:hypothetical protein [Legionella qingyii]PWY54286.1 hypothetical protein DGG96_17700 [Legionella qingyii]RUR23580.1 hypothetical protein ELY16_13025 [Legionella qingyii]RUR24059.1 hypothetical protein ELY20_05705 [Legionella qingyii]